MSFDDLLAAYRVAFRSDRRDARRLALAYARKAGPDPERRAEGLVLRAEVDAADGKLRAAADGFERARVLFRNAGRPARVLQADIGGIQALGLLGRAQVVRRRAKSMRALATRPLHRAYAEIAIGTALTSLGDERAAEACYREALSSLGRRRTPVQVPLARATAKAQHRRPQCRLGTGAPSRDWRGPRLPTTCH